MVSGIEMPRAGAVVRAFVMASAASGILLVVGYLGWGWPQSDAELGVSVGRMVFPLLIGAAITHGIANNAGATWSWGRYFAVALVATSVPFVLLVVPVLAGVI